MSVYAADIFAILLNHATKFKEVKIREKVSPVLVSNGRNDLKYGSSRKIREIWQPYRPISVIRYLIHDHESSFAGMWTRIMREE